jgi:hypothetical protein
VGAQKHGPRVARLADAGEEVPAFRAGQRAGVVLGDLEAGVPKLRGHAIGAGALVAEWALDPAELGEQVVEARALRRGRGKAH